MSAENVGATVQQLDFGERMQDFMYSKAAILGSVGLGVLGVTSLDIVPSEAAETGHKPVQPKSLIVPINIYAEHMVKTTDINLDLRKVVVSSHELLRVGVCDGTKELGKEVKDTLKGEYGVSCPWTHAAPALLTRQRMEAAGYGEPSMDYQPLLTKLGNKVARSVGLSANQYDTADAAVITFNSTTHSSQAVIDYSRSNTQTATRDIKQLQLEVHNGVETIKRKWY